MSAPVAAPTEEVQLQYLFATVTLLSGCAAVCFFASAAVDRVTQRPNTPIATLLCLFALSATWYTTSMTLTLFNRLLLGYLTDFSWPVTMSLSHMAIKGLLAVAFILFVTPPVGVAGDLPPLRRAAAIITSMVKSQELTSSLFWLTLVPLGAATAIDVVLSAMSLQYIDVSVYTVTKSTALIFTLFFSLCAGLQRPSAALLLAVAAVGVGVILGSVRESAVDLRGLLCALTAAACGAARWVLTERYFSRRGVPSHPLCLITLLSPITVVTLLPALVWEAPALAAAAPALSGAGAAAIFTAMTLGGGVLAFLLLLVELQLVRMTSALTLNVIGHFKDVVVIGLA